MKPKKLKPGDTVRFVSPASTSDPNYINEATSYLQQIGLKVQVSKHAFDKLGNLAGKDEDRLSDLNNAIRDPSVDATIATRGGKGAYRISNGLDFEAMRKNPKLLVGFSETNKPLLRRLSDYPELSGLNWESDKYINVTLKFR